MIPILYESTESAFVSNGICRLRDCLNCVVTEERNGIYECDFDYPVDGAHFLKAIASTESPNLSIRFVNRSFTYSLFFNNSL